VRQASGDLSGTGNVSSRFLPGPAAVVVDKHGGTLTYETEMGKGTAFRIRLPLATAEAAEMAPIRQGAATPGERRVRV